MSRPIFFQAQDFELVQRAFRVLDFSSEAVDSIWSLVAAILHIGNIEFEMAEEGNTDGVRFGTIKAAFDGSVWHSLLS